MRIPMVVSGNCATCKKCGHSVKIETKEVSELYFKGVEPPVVVTKKLSNKAKLARLCAQMISECPGAEDNSYYKSDVPSDVLLFFLKDNFFWPLESCQNVVFSAAQHVSERTEILVEPMKFRDKEKSSQALTSARKFQLKLIKKGYKAAKLVNVGHCKNVKGQFA